MKIKKKMKDQREKEKQGRRRRTEMDDRIVERGQGRKPQQTKKKAQKRKERGIQRN